MTHRPEPITPNGEIRIWQARTADHIDAARSLFRDFVAWHRATHSEDLALIERYFDEAAFEDELGGLPGAYEPPAGSLLVAMAGERPAGCVALRDLGGGDCEMKRMFVPEEYRGQKIGWQLAEKVIADAQGAGYRTMRLDTSRRQVAAIALYERLGFRRVAAYYDLPAELARLASLLRTRPVNALRSTHVAPARSLQKWTARSHLSRDLAGRGKTLR